MTTGILAVSRLAPMPGTSPAELLRMAATAEKYSNHPTAKALVQLAGETSVPLLEASDFRETAGRGIEAEVEGERVMVGRASWLREHGVAGSLLVVFNSFRLVRAGEELESAPASAMALPAQESALACEHSAEAA